jgi:tetratricopeptide (TPR) repeat protein
LLVAIAFVDRILPMMMWQPASLAPDRNWLVFVTIRTWYATVKLATRELPMPPRVLRSLEAFFSEARLFRWARAKAKTWPFAVLLLVLAAAGAYINAAPRALALDDKTLVFNPEFGGIEAIPELVMSPLPLGSGWERSHYRPVPMATLAIDRSLYRGDPRGYHLTNIALHVIATLVVYGCVRAFGAEPLGAFLAALIFAVHPVHTEAVDEAMNRSEILATTGVIGSIWLLLALVERRPMAACCGAAAIYFLALLCKESAVTLPLLAVLPLWFRSPPAGSLGWKNFVGLALAFAVPLTAYLALRQMAIERVAVAVPSAVASVHPDAGRSIPSLVERVAIAVPTVASVHSNAGRTIQMLVVTLRDYLRLLVWPWPLRILYDDYVIRGVWLAWLVHGLLLTSALLLRRRAPALTFAVAFFYIAILPSSRLVRGAPSIGERCLYLPSAGAAIALGFGFDAVARRWGPKMTIAMAMPVFLIFTMLTLRRNLDWRSDRALFEREALWEPNDGKILNVLSWEDLSLGHDADALLLCDRGIRLYPTKPVFYRRKGIALAHLKRYDEAEVALKRAVEVSPRSAIEHDSLGMFYQMQGKKSEAFAQFLKAAELAPRQQIPPWARSRDSKGRVKTPPIQLLGPKDTPAPKTEPSPGDNKGQNRSAVTGYSPAKEQSPR